MMKLKQIRAKRKIEPVHYIKKLRSEISRRKRTQISPILCSSFNFHVPRKSSCLPNFSKDSSCCSNFGGEGSSNSSRNSMASESTAKSKLRKTHFGETEASGAEKQHNENDEGHPLRRITRSYYRLLNGEAKEEKKEVNVHEAEVSESSCVESNSGLCIDFLGEGSSKMEIETDEKHAVRPSASFCVEQVCSKPPIENRSSEFEFPDVLRNYDYAEFSIANSDTTTKQWRKSFVSHSDLACTEDFSYEDISEYSSSQAFSELQSDLFHEKSNLEFSDYTPSIFFDSGTEFSDRSVGDSTPSPTFTLLLQYREEFAGSTNSIEGSLASHQEEEYEDQSTFLKFENEEDEASYQKFRNRERRHVVLRDYAEEYCSMTDYGHLIIQQRSQMVNWIVELSADMELHQETTFLAVGLLDRFLSKGFFENRRNLQILGIACLTLATRIEENQPCNSVRRKNFYVGSDVYSRREVIAMEWLVEEVLRFQCFPPTVYNFLWFYLKAAGASPDVEKRAKNFAVQVLSDYVQMRYWPSTIAAALVILASLKDDRETSLQWVTKVGKTHARTKSDDLQQCIESLDRLLQSE